MRVVRWWTLILAKPQPPLHSTFSQKSFSVCFDVCLLSDSPEEEVIQHPPVSISLSLCVHPAAKQQAQKRHNSKDVEMWWNISIWHLPDKCYSIIFPCQAPLNHSNMKELFPKISSIWFSKLPTVKEISTLIGTALHLNERGKGSKHFSVQIYIKQIRKKSRTIFTLFAHL